MSDYVEIIAIVEGPTERNFAEQILVPHLALHSVFLTPVILTKPGQKGGDVRFNRMKRDIQAHLKQRADTFVTTMVDFYGIGSDWPGLATARSQRTPLDKSNSINADTMAKVQELFPDNRADIRFIPYVSMHEIEALLFSDPAILAKGLGVNQDAIDTILDECGEPENIDDSPQTAPSKRLEALSLRFRKTSTGIAIAQEMGLATIRKECPIFNTWLERLETLPGGLHAS